MDGNESIKYLKMAADNGNVDALLSYSEYLSHEYMISEKSKRYIKMSADTGDENSIIRYLNLLFHEFNPDEKKFAIILKK